MLWVIFDKLLTSSKYQYPHNHSNMLYVELLVLISLCLFWGALLYCTDICNVFPNPRYLFMTTLYFNRLLSYPEVKLREELKNQVLFNYIWHEYHKKTNRSNWIGILYTRNWGYRESKYPNLTVCIWQGQSHI